MLGWTHTDLALAAPGLIGNPVRVAAPYVSADDVEGAGAGEGATATNRFRAAR